MAMFRAPKDLYNRPPNVKQCEGEESEGSLCCDICSQGWDSDTEVDIHRASAHKKYLLQILKDENSHACRICVKPHKSKEELIRHVKSWHLLSSEDAVRVERDIFICDICSIALFNKDIMEAHMQIFHSTRDKLNTFMMCPKCLKPYRLKNFWFHFQHHNMLSVACCKICLTKCTNRREALKHAHSHPKYLFCNICQYEGRNETFFREHLAARHGNQPKDRPAVTRYKPYFLPRYNEKNMKFISDTAFKGLKLSYLHDMDVRICVLCREICHGDQSMKLHIQNSHMGSEKLSLCHVCSCGLTFKTKVLLKHHIFKSGEDHKTLGTVNSDEEVVVYAVVLVADDGFTNEESIKDDSI